MCISSKIMNLMKDMAELIETASSVVGKPMKIGTDFDVVYYGHSKPASLPDGKIAVYTFYWNGGFLKIGQTSADGRYAHQHYNVKGANSTLAGSVSKDQDMMKTVGSMDVGDWILNNCERIDVLISCEKDPSGKPMHDKLTLNFVEGLFHYKYQPKYEDR